MTGFSFLDHPDKYTEIFFEELNMAFRSESDKVSKRLTTLKKKLIDEHGIFATGIFCDSIIKWQLAEAVQAYSLGLNHLVYVELHAILEMIVISILPRIITNDSDSNAKENLAIKKLIERSDLNDLIPVLEIMNIWDRNDVIKATELSRKRNAVAHFNFEKISKSFSTGKDINLPKAKEILKKDKFSCQAIVNVTGLIYKILSFNKKN